MDFELERKSALENNVRLDYVIAIGRDINSANSALKSMIREGCSHYELQLALRCYKAKYDGQGDENLVKEVIKVSAQRYSKYHSNKSFR